MPFLQKVCFCRKLTRCQNILQHLLIFGQYRDPQIPLTAEQAAAGVCFLRHVFFQKKNVFGSKTDNISLMLGQYLLIFIKIYQYTVQDCKGTYDMNKRRGRGYISKHIYIYIMK